MSVVLSFSTGLSKKAYSLMDRGEHKNAVRLYHRLTQMNPKSIGGWFGKAFSYQELEEYRKAIYCYQQVHRYDRKDIESWNNSAICYWELGYKKAAICRYRTAIDLQVEQKIDDPYIFTNLFNTYRHLGQLEDALLVADFWMKTFPDSKDARWVREQLLCSNQIKGVVKLRGAS